MQYSLWNLWASRRGRCSIPCGTCGAEGVVGAVFLVELQEKKNKNGSRFKAKTGTHMILKQLPCK